MEKSSCNDAPGAGQNFWFKEIKMKCIHARSALRSAQRLAEAEEYYSKTGDPFWLFFLKRESSILLRRAFKIWLRLKFRRIR